MSITTMKLSQNGYHFIKKWEGEHLHAYLDPVGVWTIGVGHTGRVNGRNIHQGMRITSNQSATLLQQDVESHVFIMKQLITTTLTQNQFDALASFCFNLGPYILSHTTLLSAINKRDWTLATNQMKRYVYAGGKVLPGLVNRRKAESELFLKDIEKKPTTSNWQQKNGTFKLTETINLRSAPKTNSQIIATLKPGDLVKFDGLITDTNGYIWLRQPRGTTFGYLASGQSKHGKRISWWGKMS